MTTQTYKFKVSHLGGLFYSEHKTLAAAEKMVAKFVKMSNGKMRSSDFKIETI